MENVLDLSSSSMYNMMFVCSSCMNSKSGIIVLPDIEIFHSMMGKFFTICKQTLIPDFDVFHYNIYELYSYFFQPIFSYSKSGRYADNGLNNNFCHANQETFSKKFFFISSHLWIFHIKFPFHFL